MDAGGNAKPVMKLSTPAQEKELIALKEKVSAAEAAMKAGLPAIDSAQAEWEKSVIDAGSPSWSVIANVVANPQLVFRHFKDQLVMNLENHACSKLSLTVFMLSLVTAQSLSLPQGMNGKHFVPRNSSEIRKWRERASTSRHQQAT